MKDVNGLELLEVVISADGTQMWINGHDGCLFRACRIKEIKVLDNRKVEPSVFAKKRGVWVTINDAEKLSFSVFKKDAVAFTNETSAREAIAGQLDDDLDSYQFIPIP